MNKTKKEKKENDFGDWKNIFQVFISNATNRLMESASEKINQWVAQIKRKSLGFFMILVGFVFFLISLSLLINTLFGEEFVWLGYGVVGLALIAVGYIMSEK